ncbi:uncharacterized protein LOC143738887 isoform X1 [Siphateles boraxobius]|uniref:uncharacterized protein LOC143738887 isoform X1 n=1 Tax=Siphateles boraxobius TaxID=180520 RepID=UPI0040628AF4
MINIKTSTVTLLILQLTSNFDEFTVREENQISIMTYRELSIRQIYERYIGTAAPYRRVRVVSKRPAQSYRGDAGHTHTHTHHSESSQEHRDTLLYHRCLQQEALYFCKRQHVDRPQEHLRADGDCVRSRSRSARVPKHPQNTSATRPENQSEHLMLPDVCVNFINPSPDQGKLRPSSDLSGGSQADSPHASASASKIFFSDLDVIPGLGGDPEEPAVEEQCAQAIRNRARDIEKLYKQDGETLGMVVKMLISKDPTLEQKLLTALKQNLVDIREKCLENLSQFISEVNALLKPR